MVTATNVPVSGFSVPPAGAPTVPSGNEAPQVPQGFAVPPAGDPPRLPGNGNPITLPGQQPGHIQPAQQQPAQPAQQAQPALSQTDIVALVQKALSGTQDPNTQVQAGTVPQTRPGWLGSESVNTFDVSKIDDPIIKSMASVLQVTGKDLDLDRVLGNALAHGDVKLIDHAYLTEKSPQSAAQVYEIAKSIVQAVQAKSTQVTSEVHALVGGEANWNASVAAFNKTAPAELRTVVANMLDSASPEYIKAGAKLVAEFGRASGQLPQVGSAPLNFAAGAGAAQGLSKAQFQTELAKLNKHAPDYADARDALIQRRTQGKAIGL